MTVAATIPALFRDAVRRHGSREALIHRDVCWTYDELYARVSAAAALLRARARDIPRRVALAGANDPAYVIGYFAAHALGASTVEIGRDESLDNILDALRITQTDLVLTDRADLLAAVSAPAIGFEELLRESGRAAAAVASSPADAGVHAGDEASVVFTSGTTGTPKGVVLSHRNILFVVDAVCDYLDLCSSDRYALALPLAHTYGKSNLLSAIAAGAAVVFADRPQDPAAFFRGIVERKCTVLSLVPFHLNMMARALDPAIVDGAPVRAITSSGGPLPKRAAQTVAALFPAGRLFSMYGLTESATRLTYLPPDWLSSKPDSVGRPLPGVSIEIRDDDGLLLPAGNAGHVFARGPNVMQGYVGDPDLTAATLIDGWLRTGDIGYLDADGCLFLTGRDKEIIKVAGERISPAEIEEVIAAHPGVAEAAVRGVPDALLGETIWAYVVPRSPHEDLSGLAAWCTARLSPHKVPRRILETSDIPRTPTGKVRRFLLKETAT